MKLKSFAFILAALAISLQGCSSAKKIPSPEENPVDVAGPPQPFGPLDETSADADMPESYGPPIAENRSVVLVFGPGQAHAYSYVGVLRALEDAKIPVGAIVATELGAWVGAIYGMTGSVNQFEWSLLKFKPGDFSPRPQILSGFLKPNELLPSDGDGLREKLDQLFGNKDLRDSRVPLKLIVAFPDENELSVITGGSVIESIRASAAWPGVMETGSLQGLRAHAATIRPFPVSEAKSLALGPVVVVDATGARLSVNATELEKNLNTELRVARSRAEEELKQADLVIRPALSEFSYFDFKKRTEMIFRGKRAIKKHLAQLKQLLSKDTQDD